MAGRFTAADIPGLSGRTVFFDANVILYLFWPVPSERNWSDKYASIFGKLRANKNPLAVNSFVLSEIINRVLRLEYKSYEDAYSSFKIFRNSPDGRKVQEDIFYILKDKVLNSFSVTDKQMTAADIKNMLAVDNLDFNDKIIVDVCKEYNMVLLTNDADFAAADIDILSANKNLK